MLDIRKKFLISFGVLVVLIATVGAVMIRQVDRLGEAIDVILRENYRSVEICRKVDDILEEVNGGLLRSFRDGTAEENGGWKEAVRELRAAWDAELRNVTVKGELDGRNGSTRAAEGVYRTAAGAGSSPGKRKRNAGRFTMNAWSRCSGRSKN